MRLSRIVWRSHVIDPALMRERYDFLCWLERSGASTDRWMLEWQVRW